MLLQGRICLAVEACAPAAAGPSSASRCRLTNFPLSRARLPRRVPARLSVAASSSESAAEPLEIDDVVRIRRPRQPPAKRVTQDDVVPLLKTCRSFETVLELVDNSTNWSDAAYILAMRRLGQTLTIFDVPNKNQKRAASSRAFKAIQDPRFQAFAARVLAQLPALDSNRLDAVGSVFNQLQYAEGQDAVARVLEVRFAQQAWRERVEGAESALELAVITVEAGDDLDGENTIRLLKAFAEAAPGGASASADAAAALDASRARLAALLSGRAARLNEQQASAALVMLPRLALGVDAAVVDALLGVFLRRIVMKPSAFMEPGAVAQVKEALRQMGHVSGEAVLRERLQQFDKKTGGGGGAGRARAAAAGGGKQRGPVAAGLAGGSSSGSSRGA